MTGWLNGWDGAGGLTLCHIAALTGGGLPGLGPFQLLSRDGGGGGRGCPMFKIGVYAGT